MSKSDSGSFRTQVFCGYDQARLDLLNLEVTNRASIEPSIASY